MSKKTLRLKLTPFSYKIILARYGNEILINSRSNKELCDALQKLPIHQPDVQKDLLCCEVEITITGRLAELLKSERLPAIGLALHTEHTKEMYQWIFAQTFAGITAYTSLGNYLKLYDIDEEDFSFDSAYRGWLRYQKMIVKRVKSVRQIAPLCVTSFIEQLKAKLNGGTIPSKEVQNAVCRYCKMEAVELSPQIRSSNDQLIPAMILYVFWKELSGLSMRQIAKKANKSASTIHHHINNFPKRLEEDLIYRNAAYSIAAQLLKVLVPHRAAS